MCLRAGLRECADGVTVPVIGACNKRDESGWDICRRERVLTGRARVVDGSARFVKIAVGFYNVFRLLLSRGRSDRVERGGRGWR